MIPTARYNTKVFKKEELPQVIAVGMGTLVLFSSRLGRMDRCRIRCPPACSFVTACGQDLTACGQDLTGADTFLVEE